MKGGERRRLFGIFDRFQSLAACTEDEAAKKKKRGNRRRRSRKTILARASSVHNILRAGAPFLFLEEFFVKTRNVKRYTIYIFLKWILKGNMRTITPKHQISSQTGETGK